MMIPVILTESDDIAIWNRSECAKPFLSASSYGPATNFKSIAACPPLVVLTCELLISIFIDNSSSNESHGEFAQNWLTPMIFDHPDSRQNGSHPRLNVHAFICMQFISKASELFVDI